jgi:hypothetical protein
MNVLAAWLILLIFLGFSLPPFHRFVKSLNKRLGDWTVAFLLLPYLLAVGFHPSWQDFLRMILFISLPTLLMRLQSEILRSTTGPYHPGFVDTYRTKPIRPVAGFDPARCRSSTNDGWLLFST